MLSSWLIELHRQRVDGLGACYGVGRSLWVHLPQKTAQWMGFRV